MLQQMRADGMTLSEIKEALRKPEMKDLAEQIDHLIKLQPKTKAGKPRKRDHIIKAAQQATRDQSKPRNRRE